MKSKSPAGSTLAHGLEHAVGARGVVGARHDRLAAGLANGRNDRFVVGRHDHAAHLGCHGALPHVHDHRLAADVGQRLVGQPASTACGPE